MPVETIDPTRPALHVVGPEGPAARSAPPRRADRAPEPELPVDRVELSPEARNLAQEALPGGSEHELDLQLSPDELRALASGDQAMA